MNQIQIQKKKKISRAITKLAILFNKMLETEELMIWTDELVRQGFEPKEVALGCERITKDKNIKFFPNISQLISKINDIDGIANRSCEKVRYAIRHFGPYKPHASKKYLGNKLWGVLRLYGGWDTLCDMTSREVTYMLRDLGELIKDIAMDNPKSLLSGDEIKRLIKNNKLLK